MMIVTPSLQITKWRLKKIKRLAQGSGSDRMRTQNCLMGVSLHVAALLIAAWSMFQKENVVSLTHKLPHASCLLPSAITPPRLQPGGSSHLALLSRLCTTAFPAFFLMKHICLS